MRGDVSEIEKLVVGSSVLLGLLLFGTANYLVTEPIAATIAKAYEHVHPEVRKPFEAVVSRAYKNARTTRKSIRKSRGYENLQIVGNELGKLFYPNKSLLSD
jgi:hypothetical protein